MKPVPKPSITELFEHYGARVLGADTGGWQKATCALSDHDDNSPSASVNETECKWKCWGCGKSGDAIDLIQENENVEFREAVDIARKTHEQGGGSVERGASSLHPSGTSRPGRRNWSPPWSRF